ARGLSRPGSRRARFRLEDAGRLGFVELGREDGEEIVLGLIGRFWRPGGGIVRIEPGEFTTFDRPGFAKAAWNFRVLREGEGSTGARRSRPATGCPTSTGRPR